jgi:enoyl-[acyl-carrier protein] reductase III
LSCKQLVTVKWLASRSFSEGWSLSTLFSPKILKEACPVKISFHSALITGSSRGLGRAIAVKLAQEGVAKIAVHYNTNQEEAKRTLASVRAAGSDGVLVQGDTSNSKRAETIVDEAAEKLGSCDIFIQSVVPRLEYIFEPTLATEVPLEKWQIAYDTQARAFFVGAKAAAKYMTRGGRIQALSYTPGALTGGWQPWVGMGSAKAALESMCRYFAVALGRNGVTVNAVSPGVSDDTTVIGQTPKEVQDALKDWAMAGWTPMRRRVAPADIANVCALLCSDEAAFVTGQTIAVDGGSSLMNPDFPLPLQVPK